MYFKLSYDCILYCGITTTAIIFTYIHTFQIHTHIHTKYTHIGTHTHIHISYWKNVGQLSGKGGRETQVETGVLCILKRFDISSEYI